MDINFKVIDIDNSNPNFKYFKISTNRKNIDFIVEDTVLIGEIDYNPYNKEQRILRWQLTEKDIRDILDLEQNIRNKLSKIIDLSSITTIYSGVNNLNKTIETKVIDRKKLKISKKFYYLEELGKGEYEVMIRLDAISWESEKGKITYYYSTREIDALS
jgi:hypothetical protein